MVVLALKVYFHQILLIILGKWLTVLMMWSWKTLWYYYQELLSQSVWGLSMLMQCSALRRGPRFSLQQPQTRPRGSRRAVGAFSTPPSSRLPLARQTLPALSAWGWGWRGSPPCRPVSESRCQWCLGLPPRDLRRACWCAAVGVWGCSSVLGPVLLWLGSKSSLWSQQWWLCGCGCMWQKPQQRAQFCMSLMSTASLLQDEGCLRETRTAS